MSQRNAKTAARKSFAAQENNAKVFSSQNDQAFLIKKRRDIFSRYVFSFLLFCNIEIARHNFFGVNFHIAIKFLNYLRLKLN